MATFSEIIWYSKYFTNFYFPWISMSCCNSVNRVKKNLYILHIAGTFHMYRIQLKPSLLLNIKTRVFGNCFFMVHITSLTCVVTYERLCIIFAVDWSDVFPVDSAGVYPEFWGSLSSQLVPQRSPTVDSSEGCVVPPVLADVWRTVPGKQRRCFDYSYDLLNTLC